MTMIAQIGNPSSVPDPSWMLLVPFVGVGETDGVSVGGSVGTTTEKKKVRSRLNFSKNHKVDAYVAKMGMSAYAKLRMSAEGKVMEMLTGEVVIELASASVSALAAVAAVGGGSGSSAQGDPPANFEVTRQAVALTNSNNVAFGLTGTIDCHLDSSATGQGCERLAGQ